MTERNRKILLASRPQGAATEQNFRIVDAPLPEPAEGEVLVKNEWLSLDPYMRGRMSDAKSYVPPAQLDEVMVGQTVGEVIRSRDATIEVGEKVLTQLGWQSHGVAKAADVTTVDARRVPASYYLGVLGMPGLTAWFGLFEIGRPKAGETVLVSAASGAVGSVVGQLAKIHGCRVVGIAGGADKCRYITEIGFDAAIDYKSQDVRAQLREHCPKGIDVYFDNVGGDILEAALARLARGARIVICGAISQYNSTTGTRGPANYMSLLVNRASMTGMVVFDYADRYGEAAREMAGWIAAGKLKAKEDVVPGGIEAFPDVLLRLFRGENTGKLVLAV